MPGVNIELHVVNVRDDPSCVCTTQAQRTQRHQPGPSLLLAAKGARTRVLSFTAHLGVLRQAPDTWGPIFKAS